VKQFRGMTSIPPPCCSVVVTMFAKSLSWLSLSLILLTASAVPALADTAAFYKFSKNHIAPLVALEEVAKLADQKNRPLIAEPELEIFKRIAAGHPEQCDVKDTLIVASGITDPQKRLKYAEKIDAIANRAGQAISSATTLEEKAKALAKYLYKHPLHGGFKTGQVNMALLLDKGTFNCVSSAILYSVVGLQLGIKTRAQEIPQHVFLQMGDLCIEPTGGFAQSTERHQKILDEQWAEADSTDPLIYGDKHYRSTNRMGLIGAIYYDRSNNRKKFEDKTADALKACCLCPTNTLYADGVGIKLHNWVLDAVNHKDYAKAKKIVKIAGQLFGDTVSTKFLKMIPKSSR